MNIEEQVLSIEQVRELQELGFDVKKYSSMYFVPNWITKYGIDEIQNYLLTIGELGDDYKGDCIPTMSIGVIINILPIVIEENVLNIFAFGETWSVGWEGIQYCGSNTLIDALFETLKWCIKEKHIEL